MEWHDLVGSGGAAMIVFAYALLQAGRMSSESLSYSTLNALGAALILVSLTVDFNFSALLIEAFWLAISVYGIAVRLRRPRGIPRNQDGPPN